MGRLGGDGSVEEKIELDASVGIDTLRKKEELGVLAAPPPTHPVPSSHPTPDERTAGSKAHTLTSQNSSPSLVLSPPPGTSPPPFPFPFSFAPFCSLPPFLALLLLLLALGFFRRGGEVRGASLSWRAGAGRFLLLREAGGMVLRLGCWGGGRKDVRREGGELKKLENKYLLIAIAIWDSSGRLLGVSY